MIVLKVNICSEILCCECVVFDFMLVYLVAVRSGFSYSVFQGFSLVVLTFLSSISHSWVSMLSAHGNPRVVHRIGRYTAYTTHTGR